MRADLTKELDLLAAERPPGAQGPVPRAVHADQLPDRVHPEAAWLNRVAEKVAVEEPVVHPNLALRHDPSPGSPAGDLRDLVHHQHRRKREAGLEVGRSVRDQPAVGQRQDLFTREVRALPEIGVLHGVSPNRRT